MLDDAANIPEAFLAEISIFVASEQRLAALPDRLVNMHARAIVAINRLRHEGCRFAIALRDIVDRIFVDLHLVAHRHERVELHAKLMLC